MSIVRETYYAALWTRLTGELGETFVVMSRKVRHIETMADGELPALFMAVHDQTVTQKRGLPPKHFLDAVLLVYAANPQQDISADMALNGLIDAVEAALAPAPGPDLLTATQTLGGLVSHCWITGRAPVDQNFDGTRAEAVLRIEMEIP